MSQYVEMPAVLPKPEKCEKCNHPEIYRVPSLTGNYPWEYAYKDGFLHKWDIKDGLYVCHRVRKSICKADRVKYPKKYDDAGNWLGHTPNVAGGAGACQAPSTPSSDKALSL